MNPVTTPVILYHIRAGSPRPTALGTQGPEPHEFARQEGNSAFMALVDCVSAEGSFTCE